MTTQQTQMDRIEKMFSIMDSNYVKPEELSALLEAFMSTLKDLKADVNKTLVENGKMVDRRTSTVRDSVLKDITDSEQRLIKIISDFKQSDERQDQAIFKKLSDEIQTVRSLIPTVTPPDFSHVDKKIEDLRKGIDGLPTKLDLSLLREDVNQISSDLKVKVKKLESRKQEPMLHPVSLGNLPDVNTVGVTVGQTLIWNGTYWAPGSGGGGSTISIENLDSQVSSGGVYFAVAYVPTWIFVNGKAEWEGDAYTRSNGVITFTAYTVVAGSTVRSVNAGVAAGSNFLTDSNGNILTDSNGQPLTVN